MKKRILIIALILAIAVVAAVIVKREFFPAPGVTVQKFKRLRVGLFKREVEKILGERGVAVEDEDSELFFRINRFEVYKWVGEDGIILVAFSEVERFGQDMPYMCIPSDLASYGLLLRAGSPDLELAPYSTPFIVRLRNLLGI